MIRTEGCKKGWRLDNSYSELPEKFYSRVRPVPVSSPQLVILNTNLAESLGLDIEWLKSDEGLQVLAGNKILEGSVPIAQAYGGHQFGYFNILGDGRAVLLGEQETPSGEKFDIQLKGSGITPYSRRGDGRAALGPMLREYIISEAMQGLKIPSTRSLAVVATGDEIIRETILPGAILTRVASSHLRVGTFQFASVRGSFEDVKALADYTIKRHFPQAAKSHNPYVSLLKMVIEKQAALISKWQLVGFIHGVMNTDNMALSGETIDYGPCAFMDAYDPQTVFSSIDAGGRYAYGKQPAIAQWNLARFAETLLPLINENEEEAIGTASDEIMKFGYIYKGYWLKGMRAKLGLFNEESGDESLINELLETMVKHGADYTNTFLALSIEEDCENSTLFGSEEFKNWYKRWQQRLAGQNYSSRDVKKLMADSNPAIIPRNHIVEGVLEEAVKNKNYVPLEKLLSLLANPYSYKPDESSYMEPAKLTGIPYRTFCGT